MKPTQRLALAVLVAAALMAELPGGAAAQSARPASRQALVQVADKALARGDAVAALRNYEAAAAEEHAADIELGVVRSLMLGGHYRRALAFAAHASQAHPDTPEGARLYAQLLEVGGHGALAMRVRATNATAVTPAPAPQALARATGVLIDAGRHALLPLPAVGEASGVELQDSHGRTLAAQVVQRSKALGLALLRLQTVPFDAPQLTWAARDAFPGSPAHAVAAGADDLPWPGLRTGFVGVQTLGIDLGKGARGGAVMDGAGRLIGIALVDADGKDCMVAVGVLRSWVGPLMGEVLPATASPTPPLALDAIYESALRATVQLRSPPP